MLLILSDVGIGFKDINSKSVLANSTVNVWSDSTKKMHGILMLWDWSNDRVKGFLICGETINEFGSTYGTSTDVKIVTSQYGHVVSIQNNTSNARTMGVSLLGSIY